MRSGFWWGFIANLIVGFTLTDAFGMNIWLALIPAVVVGLWVQHRWERHERATSEVVRRVRIVNGILAEAKQLTREGWPLRNALVYFRLQMLENGFDSASTDQMIQGIARSGSIESFEEAGQLILERFK